MSGFVYEGAKLRAISFPLGGIGSGCVGLSGSGRLIDWEIFNKPSKQSLGGFTHFAVRAEKGGKVVDARVLQGPLAPPFMGGTDKDGVYGFGPSRHTLGGAPGFSGNTFKGEYPIAEIDFIDAAFPGKAKLTAFSPLIPLNDKDSSIPAAFFEVSLTNTTGEALDYTVFFSLSNPNKKTLHRYSKYGALHTMRLQSSAYPKGSPKYGELCMATDAEDVSYQEYWYRGNWFDNLAMYFKDLNTPGKLPLRAYPPPKEDGEFGGEDVATIAAHISCEPGKTVTVHFVMTWHFPNCYNYWNKEKAQEITSSTPGECGCGDCGCEGGEPHTQWRNYYATLFDGASDSAIYSLTNFDKLKRDTLLFKDTLFSSTLPEAAIDAISANISILKSPTCLRLEDGSFYAWEGCSCEAGCCEGSCTHVWNYAYALPFLFPALERSMRELDYAHNLKPDGAMPFRLQLPVGTRASDFRPCCDGQFGGVLKMYREWKISGDTGWLRKWWPSIKASIEYAWSDTNTDRWDPDKSGVLTGRQHHTLDMELFGPNAWLTGFYLGALLAGAEMADAIGEPDTGKLYREIFEKGKAFMDNHLFNGEYYTQNVDINDREILRAFDGSGANLINRDKTSDIYWNEEIGEMKYQIGEGCGIDQVLAQWHSNLIGLGEIYDKAQTKTALSSIYKYNFIKRMGDVFNPCRIYCLQDESGTIICAYPEGRGRPAISVPYAEETMHGFEYQAGIHMIQEGLVEQGMEIVTAVRNRYDGERRNPWNEFECGSNYARSMATYALLNAFSGFSFDMTVPRIGFSPIFMGGDDSRRFSCFWSLDCGWGNFETNLRRNAEGDESGQVILSVKSGSLSLARIDLPFLRLVKSAIVSGKSVPYNFDNGILIIDVVINCGEALILDV